MFPLIQLPKKLEEEEIGNTSTMDKEVSINSTSEEVRSGVFEFIRCYFQCFY